MTIDQVMLQAIYICLACFVVGLLLRYFRQPYLISYILAGIIIGPHFLDLLCDYTSVNHLGDFGVIILLFFIGLELPIADLAQYWKNSAYVMSIQLILALLMVCILGYWLRWDFRQILLLSFVISLSSTAVVVKILEEWNEITTEAGKNIVSILILQDILLAPMLITVNMGSGVNFSGDVFLLQMTGICIMMGIFYLLLRTKQLKLPFSSLLKQDHELQTFLAFCCCFVPALMFNMFNLSSGLGAFLGGLVIGATQETDWVKNKLEPFKVLFVAVFFVSIGMILDFNFISQNMLAVLCLMLIILIAKSISFAALMRFLKYDWATSLYVGAMLSQIGEFSFVLVTTGKSAHIITSYIYQMTVSVITLSLLISPIWIYVIKKYAMKKVMIVN